MTTEIKNGPNFPELDLKMPKSWYVESKPSKFCAGCGHNITLKQLGYAIDDLGLQDKLVFGCDIGCSLLSWDFFRADTVQTHHGRTTPTLVGVKRARPELVCVAYMGDGGAYAIGAQHLVNAAGRNDNILVVVANNANYAMTGGQMAPTTLLGMKTETTPYGRNAKDHGYPTDGPKFMSALLAERENAFVARGTTGRPLLLNSIFKKALKRQVDGVGFAFVEVLIMCPTNWRTDAEHTLEFIRGEFVGFYKTGVFLDNPLHMDEKKEEPVAAAKGGGSDE
jgi:2-oxoglutarate ferredoxin oxidoreductase subunit beta